MGVEYVDDMEVKIEMHDININIKEEMEGTDIEEEVPDVDIYIKKRDTRQ